jgi:hypothetical protein
MFGAQCKDPEYDGGVNNGEDALMAARRQLCAKLVSVIAHV